MVINLLVVPGVIIGGNLMVCDGFTCTRYKAQKPIGAGRYQSGQRRCQICQIYINWNGNNCPCCNYRLRTKPRNLKYKEQLREQEANGQTTKYGIDFK